MKQKDNLPSKGAAGSNGISPKDLKSVSEVIAYPLTRIANLSYKKGVYPEELKCANVTPLYNAQDPMLLNNYRLISLLPVFKKNIDLEFLNKIIFL